MEETTDNKNMRIFEDGISRFLRSLHKRGFVGDPWTFCFWTFLKMSKFKILDEMFFRVTEKFSMKILKFFQTIYSAIFYKHFLQKKYFFNENGILGKRWLGHFCKIVQKFCKIEGKNSRNIL